MSFSKVPTKTLKSLIFLQATVFFLCTSCRQLTAPHRFSFCNSLHKLHFPSPIVISEMLISNSLCCVPTYTREVRNEREDQLSMRKTAYKNDAEFCLLSLQL